LAIVSSTLCAVPVAGRARIRPGALRAHGNSRRGINGGNRAAAGANLDQLHDRYANRKTAPLPETPGAIDLEQPGNLRLSVGDEANLRGRSAHVEGQDARLIELGRDRAGEHGTAGGTGFHQPDGDRLGNLQRHHTAAGRHEECRTAQSDIA
jgi:hypothetical protein